MKNYWSSERKLVTLALAFCFSLVPLSGSGQATPDETRAEIEKKLSDFRNWNNTQEGLAYSKTKSGKSSGAKEKYMAKLSLGGKTYFLACRGDYTEALKLLEKLPKKDSGAGLYLRAKCLDGLHKRLDAISTYQKAKGKIGKYFEPSFRFYLNFSAAQTAAGQDLEAIKNLKIATQKSSDAEKYSATRMAVVRSVLGRLYYLEERKGQLKNAFEHYISLAEGDKSKFESDEPITVDGAIKIRAIKWLKDHPNQPAGKDPLTLCKFLTTAAKAHIAAGDLAKAKESLANAIELKEVKTGDIPPGLAGSLETPLSKAKNEAGALLIRLDLKEKDYKSACKHVRAILPTDPAREDAIMFTALSMRDFSQLINQSDRDLHSTIAEERIDLGF